MHCFEACLQEEVGDVSGITHQFLKNHYPELKPQMADWFRTVGYAGFWQVSYHDDYELVALEACSGNEGKLRYRCPETLSMKSFDAVLAEVKQVRAEKIVTGLAELLDIPEYLHADARQAVVGDCLWKIGRARLRDGFHYPVWLFRSAGTHTDQLMAGLNRMGGHEKGLILTATDEVPLPDELPEGFVWMPFKDALISHLSETHLDREVLPRI